MFKKILLSTLLGFSAVASAELNLDLNLTIVNSSVNVEKHVTGSVVVPEDVISSIHFKDLDSLVINILPQIDAENNAVIMQVQFFQIIDDAPVALTEETLSVSIQFGQSGAIIINESNESDNNGSLVLTITPSQTE